MKEYSYNIINDVYNWMISRKKDINTILGGECIVNRVE